MADQPRPILMSAAMRVQSDGVIAEVALLVDGHEVRTVAVRPLEEAGFAAADATAKALTMGYGVEFKVMEAGDVSLGGFRMASVVVESSSALREFVGSVVIGGENDVARAFAKAVLASVNRLVTSDTLLDRLRERSPQI
jgi:hypothetical protein